VWRELKAIVPNIEEPIIKNTKRKRVLLSIYLPNTVDAELACDCMEKLISVTYRDFAKQLDEPSMPEFDAIAAKALEKPPCKEPEEIVSLAKKLVASLEEFFRRNEN